MSDSVSIDAYLLVNSARIPFEEGTLYFCKDIVENINQEIGTDSLWTSLQLMLSQMDTAATNVLLNCLMSPEINPNGDRLEFFDWAAQSSLDEDILNRL